MTETTRRIQDPTYELMDRATLKALQFQRLQSMLEHVAATNPFYSERWKAAGVDIASLTSLEDFTARVPMVEKKDFVLDQETEPPFGSRLRHPLSLGDRVEVYTTSGTTGRGVEIHLQTERELSSMVEMYGYGFKWAGLERGDQVLLTLPMTMFGGGRVEWQGATGYGLTVFPAGNYDAQEKLELLRRFKPKGLYGSTSYFGHLAAVSESLPPCSSIDVLLTGLEGVGFSFLDQLQQHRDRRPPRTAPQPRSVRDHRGDRSGHGQARRGRGVRGDRGDQPLSLGQPRGPQPSP
jgi:phenylacetate-CoA ligase